MRTKIKTLDIQAYEWLDRINGNSYYAGNVTINYGMKTETAFNMPFDYGYGSYYEEAARNILKAKKFIPSDVSSLRRYCQENNIILRSSKQTNCKKSVLKQFND